MFQPRVNFNDSMNRAPIRRKTQWLALLFAPLFILYVAAAPILLSAKEENREIVLVALGDSLTAGLGVKPEESFASQLEAALKKKGHRVQVINAGVSGDTTAAGLARLDWAVPDKADAVIVELGANDVLRGLRPDRARANLDAIVTRLKKKGADILLAGMVALRNFGPEYAKAFDPIYADLAKKHDVLLYPFFLEGVVGERALNQPDGLHPNPKGVAVIVKGIMPSVEQLLERVRKRLGDRRG